MSELFVCYDLESSGPSAFTDRIIEIGAVKFDRQRKVHGRFSRLVNPGCPINDYARMIHGISDWKVRHESPLIEVLPLFFDFIRDTDLIVAQMGTNKFDVALIHAELERLNYSLEVPVTPVISNIPFIQGLYPDFKSYSLEKLARVFGFGYSVEHRAFADALLLSRIFLRAMADNSELTVARILEISPGYLLQTGDRLISVDFSINNTQQDGLDTDDSRFLCECGVPY